MISALYVDDEPGLLELGRTFLEQDPEFRVHTAPGVADALRVLGKEEIDVIIADYQMPGKDGIEFLKEFRAIPDRRPFILFTGKGREEVAIEAINSGVDFYLQKGGDPRAQFAELAHKIRQAVARWRAERELEKKHEELRAAYEQLTASEEELRANYEDLGKSEEALRNSRNFLNSIIEQSPNSMMICDAKGTLISVNRACCELLNVTPGEVTGTYNVLEDPAVRNQGLLPLVRSVFDEGKTVRFEVIYDSPRLAITPSSPAASVILDATMFPVRDVGGKITNAVIQHTDITGRKWMEEALRASEEKYRGIFENTPVAVFQTRPDGSIATANPAFARLLGYDTPEMAIRGIPDIRAIYVDSTVRDELFRILSRQDAVADFEFALRRLDGETVWVSVNVRALHDSEGRVTGLEGLGVDITERRQTQDNLRVAYERLSASEEKLREQLDEIVRVQEKRARDEKNFRVVVDNAPDAVYIQTNDQFRYINSAALRLLGASSADEMLGKSIWDRIHPSCHERIRERVKRTTVDLQPVDLLEEIWIKLDGTPVDVEVKAVPFYYEGKHGALVILHDISVRKLAENALRQANLVVENSPVVVFRWKAAEGWPVAYVSNNVTRFGYTPEELLSGTVLYAKIVHPDDLGRVADEVQKYSDSGAGQFRQEYRIVTRDGDVRWVDDRTVIERDAAGEITHYQGIIIDITDRRKAEEELRESEERYRTLVKNAPDAIYIAAEGRFAYLNAAALRLLGASSADQLLGTDPLDRIHPDFHGIVRERVRILTVGRKPVGMIDEVYLKLDGTPVDVEVSAVPLAFQGKDGTLVFLRDITGRKRMEANLQETRDELEAILKGIADGIIVYDRAGAMIFVNDVAARLTGFESAEALQHSYNAGTLTDLLEFLDDEGHPFPAEKTLTRSVLEGEPGKVTTLQYRIKSTGEVKWVVLNVQPITGADGSIRFVAAIYHDITRLKQSELALRDANRKLQLLSGITRHDILNQLMVAETSLELAAGQHSRDSARYFASLKNALDTIERKIRFTSEYQKLGMRVPVWQEVCRAVRHAAAQLSPGGMEVACDCPGLELFADPMLENVFYNLVENTIRHGGNVTEIRVRCEKSPPGLLLIYQDNGCGIPAGMKDRIFDYGVGDNTGLGLFLSREILSITGISVRETGEPGRGARFEIRVPPESCRVRT